MQQETTQTVINLATLAYLEGLIRAAQSRGELQFVVANDTRRLVPYRQGFLLIAGTTPRKRYRVAAASSIAKIDPDAPMIQWLERAVHTLRKNAPLDMCSMFTEKDCPEPLQEGWKEFTANHILWCPLQLPDKTVLGGLWLDREIGWMESEPTLVRRVAEAYAYAWKALGYKTPLFSWQRMPRRATWAVLIGAIAVLCIPLRLSTLAPAEIIAKDPSVVSAPMDGVIADLLVPPNTLVAKEEPIFVYQDTNLRNQYEVAEKQLAVAKAEYHQTAQAAFFDAQRKAQIPLLQAEAELRATERDYAKELLDQVKVKALRAGLLLYTDKSDWVGRPVQVGERIMEIADPSQIEVSFACPHWPQPRSSRRTPRS